MATTRAVTSNGPRPRPRRPRGRRLPPLVEEWEPGGVELVDAEADTPEVATDEAPQRPQTDETPSRGTEVANGEQAQRERPPRRMRRPPSPMVEVDAPPREREPSEWERFRSEMNALMAEADAVLAQYDREVERARLRDSLG